MVQHPGNWVATALEEVELSEKVAHGHVEHEVADRQSGQIVQPGAFSRQDQNGNAERDDPGDQSQAAGPGRQIAEGSQTRNCRTSDDRVGFRAAAVTISINLTRRTSSEC